MTYRTREQSRLSGQKQTNAVYYTIEIFLIESFVILYIIVITV